MADKYLGADDSGNWATKVYDKGSSYVVGPGEAYGAIKDFMSGGPGYVPEQYAFDESGYAQPRSDAAGAREYQDFLAQKYRDQIEGRGPSVAQSQLAETTAANQAQQVAMAKSGSGPLGQSGAQYQAANNAATINQAANRTAATLRAQETAAAMQGAAGLSGQQRQQDISMLTGEQQYQLGKGNIYSGTESARATQAEAQAKREQGGGILGAAGSVLGALSDERVKEGTQPASPDEMDRFLEDLAGYRYRYREGVGEDTSRERVGVMAQDMERNPVGSTIVDEDRGRKRLDADHGFGTALAAMGRLAERVAALEGGGR